jgi:hypothetical protein
MFDAGVTVQQFNHLVRERAVRTASRRVIRETGRNSKSRVAIITGLPRSEVSRISNSPDSYVRAKPGEQPMRRVLAAWFENPRFLTSAGEPATLPIFGRSPSFESLVSMHGAGIPVRAMLDELVRIHAVERIADQHVKAKSRVPISVGLTSDAITAVGERCGDLLQTLTKNLRNSAPPLFEATSLVSNVEPQLIPIIRRELADQGASFINTVNSLLKSSQSKLRKSASAAKLKCRLGVSAYYFEEIATKNTEGSQKQARRINLRRKPTLKRKSKTLLTNRK